MKPSREGAMEQEQLCCSICRKPVLPGEARYTITENHYDCEFPNGVKVGSRADSFDEMDRKVDEVFAMLGQKRKRIQAALGTGGPTRKLVEIILASAKEHFETDDVVEVKIYLPPPVWRQVRFDVQRLEGSMLVCGKLVLFASWCTVSELIRFKRVTFTPRNPDLELNPDRSQPRGRRRRSMEATG